MGCGVLVAACAGSDSAGSGNLVAATPRDVAFAGWEDGSWRGANIYQRRVGSFDSAAVRAAPIHPTYAQADFDALSAAGANTVVLSHAGVFAERPPYQLDRAVADNLARLVDQAHEAGLAVVIAQRTGPGRSEITFVRDDVGTFYRSSDLVETLWTDQTAQDAWVEMWTYLAKTYRQHPAVIGYDLLVEPNASVVLGDRPSSAAPWLDLHPRLVTAVRSVDPLTPVIIEPEGWASPSWSGLMPRIDAEHVVHSVHIYDPFAYAVEGVDDLGAEAAASDFAEALDLAESEARRLGAPLAVLELGVTAAQIDGDAYLRRVLSELADRRVSWSMWMWEPQFDDRWTADPLGLAAHTDPSDPRLRAYRSAWSD